MLTWNGLVGSTPDRLISSPICSPFGPFTMIAPCPLCGFRTQPSGTPRLAELSGAVTVCNGTGDAGGVLGPELLPLAVEDAGAVWPGCHAPYSCWSMGLAVCPKRSAESETTAASNRS